MQRAGFTMGAAMVLFTGCGDPLAPGDFLGDTRMELEGIVSGDVVLEHAVEPSVGIWWKWYDAGREQWNLGPIAGTPTPSFPAHFSASIYDIPPTERPNGYRATLGTVSADVGCPVVFDDRDRDGIFGHADQILAISWRHLVVYIRGYNDVVDEGLPLHFQGTKPFGLGYQVMEAACQQGGPFDRIRVAEPGTLVDIRLLDTPGQMPEEPPEDACIRFF